MIEYGKQLNIVFNESGDDPIVLESSWTGAAKREPPNLRQVGQAKPRLRALCILFILAKYRESQISAAPIDQTFQVEIAKGTWICTIANDIAGVISWIKNRFHLVRDEEVFLFASPGSTHNEGGKTFPLVTFLPKKLPLYELNLFVKPANFLKTPARLLHDDELLAYALKFEAKHWKKSAIKKLYPHLADEKGNQKQKSPSALQSINTPSDALFQACMADIPKAEGGSDAMEWKNHFDLMFRILLEKEFDSYRENCKPFFSYVGNSLSSAKLPFLWKGRTWNQRQIGVLQDNCNFYSYCNFFAVSQFINTADRFKDDKFKNSIWGEIENKDHIPDASLHIFGKLADPSAYADDGDAMDRVRLLNTHNSLEQFEKSPLIVAEAQDSIQTLFRGLEDANVSIALGTFFTQQIILIDFLNEICLPFYTPEEFEGASATHLARNIFLLKKEAASNRDLIYRFCNKRREFLDAAQAGRLLLKAQVGFLTALHRRLIALES